MDSGSSFLVELDAINRLLGVLFDSFPTQLFDSKTRTLPITDVIQKTSSNLCSLLDKGVLETGSANMRGSFGVVDRLYIKTDDGTKRLYAYDVSFENHDGSRCTARHSCEWAEYELEILIKRSQRSQFVYLKTRPHPALSGVSIYEANETLNEAIIGGLVSYLYDLGVAPCVTKTFGYYICPTRGKTHKTNLLIEKSSVPLDMVLGACYGTKSIAEMHWPNSLGRKIFSSITPNDLVIWSCHLARTLFVLKYHFGIVHFDCHQGNVLLSIVTDAIKDEKLNLVYGGEKIEDVGYFDYSLPNGKRLVLENNGYIPKLIDYGLAMADFSSSVENKSVAVQMCNYDGFGRAPGLIRAVNDRDGYGDVDFNFFVYNMVYQLFHASKGTGKNAYTPEEKEKAKRMYTEYLEFAKAVVPDFSFDRKIVVDWGDREVAYSLSYALTDTANNIFHARNMGTTSDIASPLNRIYTYLEKKGYTTESCAYVTSTGKAPTASLTLSLGYRSTCNSSTRSDYGSCPKESAHINMIKRILRKCGKGKPLSEKRKRCCHCLKAKKTALSPKSYVPLPVAIDTQGTTIWDRTTGELRDDLTYKELRPYILVDAVPNLTLYKIPYVSIVTGEVTSVYITFLASNRFTSWIGSVRSSLKGYTNDLSERKTAATFLAYTNISSLQDEDLATVSTKGKVLTIGSYSRDREYPGGTTHFKAPLAVRMGVGIPAQHDMANDLLPRSLLGLTKGGITILLMAEGGDINTEGLAADELTLIAVKLGVYAGVHLSQGWGTNSIVSVGKKDPMWVMPSNMYIYQKEPLALSFKSRY